MTNIEALTPTKIIRSKRKAISLIININGEFIVRAPLKCTDDKIFSFINKKAGWIIKKRSEVAENSKFKQLAFKDGERISLFGEEYKLKIIESGRVKTKDNIIFIPQNDSSNKLKAYLKRTLKRYLDVRVKEISALTSLKYESISISSAKTNWGSCSFDNRLHFTYKLCLCPKPVVDYIIVHELCHTKIKNHSQTFWSMVESILPNYKVYEKWLKDNRAVITII